MSSWEARQSARTTSKGQSDAQLGLKEAKKQDNHFCDMEFNDVLIRIQAISRMTTIPISKGNTNNEESEDTDPEK